jgi:predicted dehydrogenase
MKVLIIGAGRMGMRHAVGIAPIKAITQITLADISENAISSAKDQLRNNTDVIKFSFISFEEINSLEGFDYGIISATASNRIGLCEKAIRSGCKTILVEKPLGQSLAEVNELIEYFAKTEIKAFVNLNMRVYPDSAKLKHDLNTLQQFKGKKSITINTGTVGIGANGIHYLDYLFFLTDADTAKIVAADIDPVTIPSARGPQFKDFGGWCMIDLSRNGEELAKAYVSIDPESTVFGGWDIIGPHGRITINESNGKRIDYLRKENSEMPIQRYNADYMQPEESVFDSPMLGDLTRLWINGMINGEYLLPSLEEVLPSHKLMFEWLQHSKEFQDVFPIT